MLGEPKLVELLALRTPMLPPRLRATLISADAWLVFSGGRPA